MPEDQQQQQGAPPTGTVAAWGNPNPPATDLAAAAAAQQQQQEPPKPPGDGSAQPPATGQQQGAAGEAAKTPEEIEAAKQAAAKGTEGDKGEGKGDEQDTTPPEEGAIDPADALASGLDFYKKVDALHGEDLVVDYVAAGIEDPLSPEGLYLRDQVLVENKLKKYDQYMKDTNPRAYAYFLHSNNGGSDEEFFNTPTVTLPEYETFKTNVDLQKKVFTDGYKARKIPEAAINLIIEDAVKKGTFFQLADAEYNQQKRDTEQALTNLEAKTKADEEAFKTSVTQIESSIDDVIFKAKTPNLVIPDAKQADFANFVKSMLGYSDRTQKFLLSQAIEPDKLPVILEALYFQFIGGNTAALVKRTAGTVVARRLGQQVQKAAAAASGANKDQQQGGASFVPLSAIN